MSKNRFLKILLPSIALTFGTQASAYTIQEAVAQTLANSPDFLMQTNTRDVVDKQLRESYAGYLPSLDMTAGWGEQYSNTFTTRSLDALTNKGGGTLTLERTEFGLVASQMLFDGFAVYHDVKGHEARVKAESWRTNGSAQEIAIDAVDAYLRVILQRDLVRISRENLAAHESIYGQIQKRSEGGISRKADTDQAQARVALAHTNLTAAEGNLRDAETDFLRRVGIPVPSHLVIPKQPHPFPSTLNEAVDIGLHAHPILKASVEDVEVTRQAYKGAKAPFSPRFDLNLAFDHNHDVDGSYGASDDASAMIRMRWNLFNGGKDLAKICETAYQMQEAQEVENRAHRQVIESVRKDWTRFATAKRGMPYYKEHADASARTRDAYHKQFNIGQRTLLDLLDSENELYTARTNYAQAKNEMLYGMYRVVYSTGQLTNFLSIALPRQADPKPTGIMDGSARFFDKHSTLFD